MEKQECRKLNLLGRFRRSLAAVAGLFVAFSFSGIVGWNVRISTFLFYKMHNVIDHRTAPTTERRQILRIPPIYPLIVISHLYIMECQSKEDRVQLALNAFKNGQFKTKKSASLAFDVPETTLRRRIQGIASRAEKPANGQKLSITEESTLSTWILDMDKRGLPLQLSTVRHLAQLLLSARLPSS